MAPMSNLTARFVPPGEEDMHKLPESGWYAFDDKNIPAGGPFFSEEECLAVITRVSES